MHELWRTRNGDASNPGEVRWELAHDFGTERHIRLLSSGHDGTALVLYVMLAENERNDLPAELYRSMDGGASWQRVGPVALQ